jgi:hypothetical protein
MYTEISWTICAPETSPRSPAGASAIRPPGTGVDAEVGAVSALFGGVFPGEGRLFYSGASDTPYSRPLPCPGLSRSRSPCGA